MVSFIFCISPKTVGAYRIRPDVGEKGKTAASNPSFFRESSHFFGVFAYVEGVCDTPLHIYYLFVGDAMKGGII